MNLRVGILGMGYVGLPLAISAAKAGHSIIGYDTDAIKIDNLRNYKFLNPDIEHSEISTLVKNGSLQFSSDCLKMKDCDVLIICVPTPTDERDEPDLSFLISAAETCAQIASSGTLVISESTSKVGTLRDLIFQVFEKHLGSHVNSLHFAVSPERINPGSRQRY